MIEADQATAGQPDPTQHPLHKYHSRKETVPVRFGGPAEATDIHLQSRWVSGWQFRQEKKLLPVFSQNWMLQGVCFFGLNGHSEVYQGHRRMHEALVGLRSASGGDWSFALVAFGGFRLN